MAPPDPNSTATNADLNRIDDSLKSTIQSLYALMVQSSDHTGPATEAAMKRELTHLTSSLSTLHDNSTSTTADPNAPAPAAAATATASTASTTTRPGLPSLPPEVLQYVSAGRNPDIYTREFVELAQKGNQRAKGRAEALGRFRDVLAGEIVLGLGGEDDGEEAGEDQVGRVSGGGGSKGRYTVEAEVERVVRNSGGDWRRVREMIEMRREGQGQGQGQAPAASSLAQ